MTRRLRTLIVFLALVSALSCTDQPGREYQVRTDMYNQPSFRHNRDPLAAAAGTVQTRGFEPAAKDSQEAALLRNPYLFSRASEDTGKVLFETYCSPCHGPAAKGDGPVAEKFQTPPDLTSPKYGRAPDGYIYRVIRNGIRIMPPYFENTTSRDRWLIISHLRSLQQQ